MINPNDFSAHIERVEKRVDTLERLEKKLDFTSRDVSYKTDLAQGMMRQLHDICYELKADVNQVKDDTKEVKDDLKKAHEKLDLIIGFLDIKPKE